MCQHSWYNKNRRHYGPKPNTRRARGLHNRSWGKRIYHHDKMPDTIERVEAEKVDAVRIPSDRVLKRYIMYYNMYTKEYDKTRDKTAARDKVLAKLEISERVLTMAIKCCKYILFVCSQEDKNSNN